MSDKLMVREEQERLKNVLQHYSKGASIEDIEAKADVKLPRRTLQRRLLAMQHNGELYREGKTRGTKYFLTSPSTVPTSDTILPDLEGIPLSPEAKQILQRVKQPLQQRTPVGYNRDFLDRYQATGVPTLHPQRPKSWKRWASSHTITLPAHILKKL